MKRFALLLVLMFATTALADDYVVILLDTSGSMAESMRSVRTTKMHAAQDALRNLVNSMPPATQMGLLTFHDWVFPLGPVDKGKAIQDISKTYSSGGTPLGEYMKTGADVLLATREKNHGVGTYTLLVVTDGEANDNDLMLANTADIVSRGITLKTIGVNLDKDHTLATKSVAYFPADDLKSLQGALQQAVAEVPAGNDNIEEDAYALIAGLPGEMVTPLIDAITKTITFNQPIGEKPKIRVVDEKGNVSFVAPPPIEEGAWGLFSIIFVVVLGVIIVFCFILVFGKGMR
jgi:uncharacterized protein YegL